MNEAATHEQLSAQKRVDATLERLQPKPVECFVPQNAKEQKQLFLSGEVRHPIHTYHKLAALDFEERIDGLMSVSTQLNNDVTNQKFRPAYAEYAQNYLTKTVFMKAANQYRSATSEADRHASAAEYMRLNVELYGEPNFEVYQSLLSEKMMTINSKVLTGEALTLREELNSYISTDLEAEPHERFKPQDETVEWVHDVAMSLYEGMLSHVPEQESFTREELKTIFTEILEQEFGESAAGWQVIITKAAKINVKAAEKLIIIPDTLPDQSYESVRDLIVHEIGVHVLRAISGAETDLAPLANGFADYYDAEEGLGVVMGQAIKGAKGEFAEAGIKHYITAGLAYYEGKDFRDIFETKWRLAVLETVKDNEELDDALVQKKKATAYSETMRVMRGTDDLPWFKDLAYFNGANEMWQHLEAIRGDYTKLMFVLLGKANPANINHERIMYETRTV